MKMGEGGKGRGEKEEALKMYITDGLQIDVVLAVEGGGGGAGS